MSKRIWTELQFIQAVKESHSYSEVCRKLGLSPKGGNLKTIKTNIQKLKLDSSHFTGIRWNKGLTHNEHPSIIKKDISELLIENSKLSSSFIRRRLISDGIKQSKCELCHNTQWFGIPIPLELHHINGNHYDNRLENLLILCPNCHALTDSHISNENVQKLINGQNVTILNSSLSRQLNKFAQKKSKKNKEQKYSFCKRCGKQFLHKKGQLFCSADCYYKYINKCPSKEELFKTYTTLKSFTKIGKFYNVSDNTIRKWLKRYNII